MIDKLQVLFLEDNESDFVLTDHLIDKQSFVTTWARTLAEAQEKLQSQTFDIILMDLSLPDSHGIITFDKLCQSAAEFPIVVVLTGSDDEETASEALKRGAQDYLVKGQITAGILMKSLRYAVERSHAEAYARRTNDRLVSLNHQLVLARDEALEAVKGTTSFLADLSHEIRTPVSGIVSLSELLVTSDEEMGEEVKELGQAIHASALRTLSTLNGLLDLSKMEAGKMTANLESCCVRSILDDVVATVKPAADKKRLAFSSSVAAEVPQRIVTDPLRFRQVVLNFAHNAVKFTDKGTVSIHTNLAKTDDKQYLHLEVNDTGIGIAQSAHDKLFEAFVQASGFISKDYGGTGLGLAISKRSVELLAGEIGFKSSEGHGSTFWFRIPANIAS